MKVLVTAFKPFYKGSNNYSEEVIKYIENVDKVILDVVYDKCYDELSLLKDLDSFDLIIALGEARMRSVISLELSAKNIASCSIQDNAGIIKNNEIIDNKMPNTLNTLVDVDKVKDLIMFSTDAGKFVCNNLYFYLLKNYPTKSIFIHIPNCQDNPSNYKEHALTINKIIKKLGE